MHDAYKTIKNKATDGIWVSGYCMFSQHEIQVLEFFFLVVDDLKREIAIMVDEKFLASHSVRVFGLLLLDNRLF